MRRGRALLICVLTILFAVGGCAEIEKIDVRRTSFFSRLQPSPEPHSADLISLEVALLERPIYDTYLDRDLWDVVDERVGSLPSLGTLQANGFRVGQLGGIVPSELLRMLTSDRSCSNPRQIGLHSGGSTTLSLGPTAPSASFRLTQDGEVKPLELDKAQFELVITPTLTDDGRTCLKCTPQITHGEESLVFRPVQGGWIQQPQRQLETCRGLSWESTVSPNEFVIIGGKMDMADTLGHLCFVRAGETPPVRRILVIRSVRAQPGIHGDAARPGDGLAPGKKTLSIAEQAANSADNPPVP